MVQTAFESDELPSGRTASDGEEEASGAFRRRPPFRLGAQQDGSVRQRRPADDERIQRPSFDRDSRHSIGVADESCQGTPGCPLRQSRHEFLPLAKPPSLPRSDQRDVQFHASPQLSPVTRLGGLWDALACTRALCGQPHP